jgi:hypothetical protein
MRVVAAIAALASIGMMLAAFFVTFGRRAPVRARSPLGPARRRATFARHWRELEGLFDRVELFNGGQLFGWVAEQGLRPVAAGDLHRADQFPGWTTLVRASRTSRRYLPSPRPVFLTRVECDARPLAA